MQKYRIRRDAKQGKGTGEERQTHGETAGQIQQ